MHHYHFLRNIVFHKSKVLFLGMHTLGDSLFLYGKTSMHSEKKLYKTCHPKKVSSKINVEFYPMRKLYFVLEDKEFFVGIEQLT